MDTPQLGDIIAHGTGAARYVVVNVTKRYVEAEDVKAPFDQRRVFKVWARDYIDWNIMREGD